MTTLILLLPLFGALICGFGYRMIGEQAAIYTATTILFLCCLLSWIVFFSFDGETVSKPLFRWVASGTLSAEWGVRVDRLTCIMLVVVTTVSSLVHLYSVGYMGHDENWKQRESYLPRFFAYLSFFTFAMLALVTADNLLQMFFGWEGVGVASYLLIGFYYRKASANNAAMKAFIVNRVGDFGFLMGIFALYFLVDSIQFNDIFAAAPDIAQTQLTFLWREWNAAEIASFLIFVGAMGKSAQLLLHTWLPDAMEGPTPVSALIHAATMVTAGVFLVCRMSPVLEYAPGALTFITFIGAATAFFAATVGLVQNDIKRVIAYSTCSQLGYMFVAAGVGAYPVAMFHLFTHAFFKALLFLGAGSVITAMHHEQDMRNYGGLKSKVPFTYWTMLAGTLAITGVGIPLTNIGFAGFLSKDAIIETSWAGTNGTAHFAFFALVLSAAFTSFYSWRLMFMTFHGKARGDHHAHDHAHESPRVMLIPLGVLAAGAIFAGMIWYAPFFGDHERMATFFGMPAHHAEAAEGEGHAEAVEGGSDEAAAGGNEPPAPSAEGGEPAHAEVTGPIGAVYFGTENTVIEDAHESPFLVKIAAFLAMALGFVIAYWFYILDPTRPAALANTQPILYRFLLNKWYFDEIYDVIFVRPVRRLSYALWKKGDGATIDGTINGVAMGFVPFVTRLAGRAQSGYLFHYALAMVIGLIVLMLWLSVGGAS
jgi:NADH-quinone oxidoreductase subunit L